MGVARAALARRQVPLQVRVALGGLRHRLARRGRERGAAQVGVHDHAGGVEHAAQRGRRGGRRGRLRPGREVARPLGPLQQLGAALGQHRARGGQRHRPRGVDLGRERVDRRQGTERILHARKPTLGAVGQYHWDPDSYLALMREEVAGYERLQEELAAATGGATAILDLGTGTGETARRVLDRNPGARLVGLDESEGMLAAARTALEGRPVELRAGRLEDPLPEGPFDLVVSALAVHHLDGEGKADLFARVHGVLAPGGRFALADVVVPEDPRDAVVPLSPDYDLPSPLADQLEWLRAAGFSPAVTWQERDLAVVAADRA